jgi:CheY-like chemotaxis protein
VPHTLLLADDSVTIQRVIELTFADEDVKVVAVSDGDQAIERLDSAPPDIVLADIGMPGKNGYEVAQYIKQSPHLSHIPVVLLTGAFEPVDQARAAAAGCDGVLAKPFEPQMVIGRVKELLGKPKGNVGELLDRTLPPPSAPSVEQWTPPLVDQAFAPGPPTAAAPADVDSYFDRLDAAFANLSPGSAQTKTAAPPADLHVQDQPLAPARSVADEIDWFATQGAAPAASAAPAVAEAGPDLPLSYASPQPDFEAPPETLAETWVAPAIAPAEADRPAEASHARSAEREPWGERPEAATLPRPVELPSLPDAFAALLAAEQGDASAAPVRWPAAGPSTEAIVDQISRRVLDQLSARADGVMRDAVAELVSQLAERLVCEEIERIKASIK